MQIEATPARTREGPAAALRKVAVTGGSGQLGTLIMQRLFDRTEVDAVLCIDRAPPRLASGKLEFMEADVRDKSLAQALAQCSALVHCAFIVTSNVSPAELRSVNIDGTINVMHAAAAAGLTSIVHLSSMMAYGCVAGHPILLTEDTPRINQVDFPYAACKHEVEAFLDDYEIAHPEIAICRLRPAVLLGRNVPHALGWLLRRHIVPWHGGAPLAIVSDEDVADLVIRALEARARGAFNASSDNLLTSQDISEQFEMTALWIPNFLIFGYRVLDRCLKSVGLALAYDASWLTKTQGVALVMSSERAKRELGWSPRYPTAASVLTRFLAIAPRRLNFRLFMALQLLRWKGRRSRIKPDNCSAAVYLCVDGEYGGDFSLICSDRRISIRAGAPPLPSGTIRTSSSILLQILAGHISLDDACSRGDLSIEGNEDGRLILNWMVDTITNLKARKMFWARFRQAS
jgi:UDP-glucose 4-epimerase